MTPARTYASSLLDCGGQVLSAWAGATVVAQPSACLESMPPLRFGDRAAAVAKALGSLAVARGIGLSVAFSGKSG